MERDKKKPAETTRRCGATSGGKEEALREEMRNRRRTAIMAKITMTTALRTRGNGERDAGSLNTEKVDELLKIFYNLSVICLERKNSIGGRAI